jgi:hypothetical protein
MKRALLAVLALALLAGGLWFGGRAPSDYVLQRECDRFQVERATEYGRLEGEAALQRDPATAAEARTARDAVLTGHRRLEIRGWEVMLIPAGAPRPPTGDFLVAGTFEPEGSRHPALQGPMTVWYAPRGPLARALYRLGLTP